MEDIFDGGAHRIGIDHHEVIYQLLGQAKGFFAHGFDGRAVGEQAHVAERDAVARAHGLQHGVGVDRLNPDDAYLGPYRFDIGRHAADQAAPTDGNKHGMQWPLVLAQDFHRHRALARDDVRIIKGVHIGQAVQCLQFLRVLGCI